MHQDPVSGKAYMVYSQHTCNGENTRALKLLQLNAEWTAPAGGTAGVPVATVCIQVRIVYILHNQSTRINLKSVFTLMSRKTQPQTLCGV